jgi:3-hydroxyacyl-[acyl-carrier-protein] dehydratase
MIDYSRIQSILPHVHPMVLVDCVVSLEPGASIIAIKAITGSEPCYKEVPAGLRPERYSFPVSLLLESFGQTAAILWLESSKALNLDANQLIMLVAARNCRIEGRAFPGDVLRHIARLDQIVGDNAFVEGETWVGNQRIATIGSMIAAMRPRSIVIGRRPQGEKEMLSLNDHAKGRASLHHSEDQFVCQADLSKSLAHGAGEPQCLPTRNSSAGPTVGMGNSKEIDQNESYTRGTPGTRR